MSENFREWFIRNNQAVKDENFDDKDVKEGKSLYEVIRVIDGYPLFLERHLKRLENSARITGLELWMDMKETAAAIMKLIGMNNVNVGNIKLVFNYKDQERTFLAYFLKHKYPEETMYEQGVKTILYHGERNNPNAKVVNLEFRNAVEASMKEKDAFEAILVDRNGYVTEGSKSNIFMIQGTKVITAPVEAVLPGTTRGVIMDKARELGYQVLEEKVHYTQVKDMDALFISGTSPKVLPIKSVDHIQYDSPENKVLLDIRSGYDRACEEDIQRIKQVLKA